MAARALEAGLPGAAADRRRRRRRTARCAPRGRRRGERVSTATPRQRPARTTPGPAVRVVRAWRALTREQRLSAFAAMSLWVTMFLPWYSESGLAVSKSGVRTGGITLTAWGAFSWVEAAVLLVSIGAVSYTHLTLPTIYSV